MTLSPLILTQEMMRRQAGNLLLAGRIRRRQDIEPRRRQQILFIRDAIRLAGAAAEGEPQRKQDHGAPLPCRHVALPPNRARWRACMRTAARSHGATLGSSISASGVKSALPWPSRSTIAATS